VWEVAVPGLLDSIYHLKRDSNQEAHWAMFVAGGSELEIVGVELLAVAPSDNLRDRSYRLYPRGSRIERIG